MIKRVIKMFFAIFVLLGFIDIVYALGTNVQQTTTGSPPSQNNNQNNSEGNNSCPYDTAGTYHNENAYYTVDTTTTSKVQLDTYRYNQQTKKYELVDEIVDTNHRIVAGTYKAGTFVGINYYEQYTEKITVNIHPYCTETTVTINCVRDEYTMLVPCNTTVEEQAYNETDGNGKIVKINNVQKVAKQLCPKTVPAQSATITSGTCEGRYGSNWHMSGEANCTSTACTVTRPVSAYQAGANAILTDLVTSVQNRTPSYTAWHDNVNNVNLAEQQVQEDRYTTITPNMRSNPEGWGGSSLSRTVTTNIKYNPGKACINVKTADIRYVSFDATCNSNEMSADSSISSRDGIGMYFIPLNAKTGSAVVKYSMKSRQKQQTGICLEIIKNYSKPGDYRWRRMLNISSSSTNDMVNMSQKEAESAVNANGGCYYNVKIYFNVLQDFYGEESNKIKGYGAYFRPIDVNNPFPNGLTNYSVWNNYYDAKDKKVENLVNAKNQELDIIKSYDKIYYRVELKNSKIKSIKAFNSSDDTDSVYTSWKAMNKNGTSNFVNSYIDNKNVSNDSFYKLGCGPLNKNWSECGRT